MVFPLGVGMLDEGDETEPLVGLVLSLSFSAVTQLADRKNGIMCH